MRQRLIFSIIFSAPLLGSWRCYSCRTNFYAMTTLPTSFRAHPRWRILNTDGLATLTEASARPRLGSRDENPAPLLVIAGQEPAQTKTLPSAVRNLVREDGPAATAAPPSFWLAGRRARALASTRFACCSTLAGRSNCRVALGRSRSISVRRRGFSANYAGGELGLELHHPDRGDSEGPLTLSALIESRRHQKGASRVPPLARIYSRAVHAEAPSRVCAITILGARLWRSRLNALFGSYAPPSSAQQILDFDDLLL